LDIQNNNIDIAWRSLTPTDIADLRQKDNVKVYESAGGFSRFFAFNLAIQPFGTTTDNPDPEKAKAVRQAVGHLVDRQAIATDVFKDTFNPLYGFVPDGFLGADTPLKEHYGDGLGKPSIEKAKAVLEDAGIDTSEPIELNIQYNTDHYDESSTDEYGAIKTQLEEGGLFTVKLGQTEWTTFNKERVNTATTKGRYPIFQNGWFPDFPDPDNYLNPIFGTENYLNNDYSNEKVDELLASEVTDLDEDSRRETIAQIQDVVADDLPIVPLLQGKLFIIAGNNIKGADEALDAAFNFRLSSLEKE
jgi:peptide/nickel transport system substrate-binding protein